MWKTALVIKLGPASKRMQRFQNLKGLCLQMWTSYASKSLQIDHAVLAQVNGAYAAKDESEAEDDDEDIAVLKVSAPKAEEHFKGIVIA